jgi:putative two-component system response regulator
MNLSTNKKTVLIVDDAPENVTILAELLSEFNIKVAVNGDKAINILSEGAQIDLILLDVIMPGIDGFEVAAKLKENPVTAKIPIIFVTGEKDVKSFIKGFELGAEDYIQKPFDPKVILFTVKSKLGLLNS